MSINRLYKSKSKNSMRYLFVAGLELCSSSCCQCVCAQTSVRVRPSAEDYESVAGQVFPVAGLRGSER